MKPVSPREVNQRLVNLGLQYKERDEWLLTEKGEPYAERRPYSKEGRSGYQILWKDTILELLKVNS